MLFADEPFWKPPNVYDTVGVIGLVLAIVSIWFAWLLAKWDIQKRLKEATEKASEAAREEIRRVSQALFLMGVMDASRSLALAREAILGKRWSRASDLIELCLEQLDRMPEGYGGVDQRLRLTKGDLRDLVPHRTSSFG